MNLRGPVPANNRRPARALPLLDVPEGLNREQEADEENPVHQKHRRRRDENPAEASFSSGGQSSLFLFLHAVSSPPGRGISSRTVSPMARYSQTTWVSPGSTGVHRTAYSAL